MTQQLMFYISRRAEVLRIIYVNRDLYLANLIESLPREVFSADKLGKWKGAIFQKIQQAEDKIWVYTPFHYFPFSHRGGIIENIDRKIYLHQLSRLFEGAESGELILFINRKVPSCIIDHFKRAAVRCFYWTDDWSSFPVGRKRISEISFQEKEESERMIEEILKRSDIVFSISEGLRQRGKRFVPWSFLLPNGTNYDNFVRASLPDTEVPTEINSLPRPIIGLMGVISSSIDFNLLTSTAMRRPDWSFVIIGPKLPAASWGEEFFRLRNVYYFGRKNYFELPKYMKAFDVCIIPYVDDESLRMADSNKLYDYLGTGKPVVVSQNTAGVGRFADLIRISKNREDFVIQIEESLRENDPILMGKRQRAARENSWEMRAEEVWSKIVQLLECRRSH